jgi:carbamoyl-phosphate synthase large subunit
VNILISAAGRRVSLTKAFVESIKHYNLDSKVFASDFNPKEKSAASHFADYKLEIGSFNDPLYKDNLIKLCRKNDISLIIPTNDNELNILAEASYEFKTMGINTIVSTQSLIEIFEDKRLTSIFFDQLGVKSPVIYDPRELKFPVFVKPIKGSNSQGVYMAENLGDIKPNDLNSTELMFMEYIDPQNFNEYTVDMFFDKNSDLVSAVPRLRIKVVGGESNIGETKKNHILDFVKHYFSSLDGAKGCITLQVFTNKKSNEIIGLEINPRFGGGYPFSLNAGANFPDMIIREYFLGETLNYSENWNENCLNLRFESEVVLINN